jgi:exonuclease III
MTASEIADGSKYLQHGMKKELRIGTWNVLTIYKEGALKQLEKLLQDYKLDIIALQEFRWIGQSVLEKRNCRVYYCCQKSKHEFGCGFVVNSKIEHSVTDFKPINHRLCTLRLRARFNNLSLICAHARTEEINECIKDSFYEELENVLTGWPKNDIEILLADFNAKVGFEDQDRSVVGKCGLHEESNVNGLSLIGLASAVRSNPRPAGRMRPSYSFCWHLPFLLDKKY